LTIRTAIEKATHEYRTQVLFFGEDKMVSITDAP